MRNKVIAALFVGFFLLLSAPIATAAEAPVLTWERGKEQNVKLRGFAATQNWVLELDSKISPTLRFHRSTKNLNGDVVYSINIPNTYKTGHYTIQTVPDATIDSRILAGVILIPLQTSNLFQIPVNLILLLLTLTFFFSTLSCMRMQKYERIEYLRPIPSAKLPNLVAACFRFRQEAVENVRRSLFKFLLVREGELLFNISPAAWALTPFITFFMGGFLTGTINDATGGAEHISVLLFVVVAIIGVIDPYSGFTAVFGFSFVQTILGRVTTVQSAMVLVAIGLSWIAPGIVASLYQDILRKDRYFSLLNSVIPDAVASFMGGLLFLASDLLMVSLADHSGPVQGHSLWIPVIIAVFVFVRMTFERFRLRNLHLTGENYQVRVLTLPRVVAPRTALFTGLFFAGVLFVWTQALAFSLTVGFLMSVPLVLLTVRFELPRIHWIAKFERNILLESTILCILVGFVMIKIADAPYDVIDKGKLLFTDTAVALIVHGAISSFVDTCSREKVLQ
jgi:hypothetical protein